MTELAKAPLRIVIECDRCGRHGEYDRDKAIERFNNINLKDFVFRIASAECVRMKHPSQNGCAAGLGTLRRRAA